MFWISRKMLQVYVLGMIYLVTIAGVVGLPWSLIFVLAGIVALVKPKANWWKHGTARWAERKDLRGMINAREGLIVGALPHAPRKSAVLGLLDMSIPNREAIAAFNKDKLVVRLTKAIHTCTCAPTRSGKGVSIILPHLLTCPDSQVVIDYKGELALLTAAYRRRFGEVHVIDPHRTLHGKIPFESATLNPLSFAKELDDAKDLAKSFVIREEKEDGNSGHFKDTAEMFISAIIATTMTHADQSHRNLQAVQDILTSPEKLKIAIEVMKRSGGMLQRMGNQLSFFMGEEKGSTLTTTARFMRFLDSERIAENSRTSSFVPLSKPMTVYIVPSLEHSKVLEPWVRMVIGVMLKAAMRGGLQERRKTHFIFDEAAKLGHMDVVDEALDKGAGYGVRCHWFFQSVNQVAKCFPGQEETFMSNVTQIFFGVNSMGIEKNNGTAEYISKRLGSATVLCESWQNGRSSGSSSSNGRDVSWGMNWGKNKSETLTQHKRELATADEVLQTPADEAIVFCPSTRPIKVKLVKYYSDKWLLKGQKSHMFGSFLLMLGTVFLCLVGTAMATHFMKGGFR